MFTNVYTIYWKNMATRYNPNDGTGRWYEDEEIEVVDTEIDWWPVVLITITALTTALFLSI